MVRRIASAGMLLACLVGVGRADNVGRPPPELVAAVAKAYDDDLAAADMGAKILDAAATSRLKAAGVKAAAKGKVDRRPCQPVRNVIRFLFR